MDNGQLIMDNLWRRGAPRRYKSNHQIFKFSNRKSSFVTFSSALPNRKYIVSLRFQKLIKT